MSPLKTSTVAAAAILAVPVALALVGLFVVGASLEPDGTVDETVPLASLSFLVFVAPVAFVLLTLLFLALGWLVRKYRKR